jgi:hypothetical protein
LKIAICGDSFCYPDSEYGVMWADLLAIKLGSDHEIINLSSVGASNMLISLQVDHALESDVDHVLCHFSSCTRETYRAHDSDLSLFEQFQAGDLIPYAIPSCTTLESTVDKSRVEQIRKHYIQYQDLDCTIYTNKCIIERVLYTLRASKCKWAWDSGGFEHHSFGGDSQQDYFGQFEHNRTGTCLWDYADGRLYRPYYHITDPYIHQVIADRYASWILK